MKNPKIKPDIIFKEFWRQNDRFASLFNTVVFEGEEVIKPEELSELDTDVSTLVEFNEYKETLSRARDVVKKAAHGVDFVIMGIENQRKTHYGMPLRVMIYDALGYLKEYQEISRKHREAGDKASAEEFLSGLHKEDRLHPIISIVIYYNEKPWDGPKSLRDMIVDMPEKLDRVFSDYPMNLLQVGESGKYRFGNEEVQIIFETARYIYGGEFDKVRRLLKEKIVAPDVGAMIGVMTDSDLLVQEALESKGGMNMCTALERLEERGREAGRIEGREEGRKEGRAEGIAEGREEGRAEGKREILFALLKSGAEIKLLKEVTGLSEEEIKTLRKEIE